MTPSQGSPTPDLLPSEGQPTNPESIPQYDPLNKRRGPHAPVPTTPVTPVAPAPLEPFAVSAPDAAKLCGVGKTLWHELDSTARIPAPIKLGARCVWVVDELRAWLHAGAPPRDQWQARKKTINSADRNCAMRGGGSRLNRKAFQ